MRGGAGSTAPAAQGTSRAVLLSQADSLGRRARATLNEALDLDVAARIAFRGLGLRYEGIHIDAGDAAGGVAGQPEVEPAGSVPDPSPTAAKPVAPGRIYVALAIQLVPPGIYTSPDDGALNTRVWALAGGRGCIKAGNWKWFDDYQEAVAYWDARHHSFGYSQDPEFRTIAILPDAIQ